ncbi:MAG: hypothetical protein Q7U04_07315 [Bacteriovorax sp.]|nr:hypothetical protein [Bacteriovorax sp.]
MFLDLSSKEASEICEFPDSKKTWDRQKKEKLFQHDVEFKNYWKDEENPDQYWEYWNTALVVTNSSSFF